MAGAVHWLDAFARNEREQPMTPRRATEADIPRIVEQEARDAS